MKKNILPALLTGALITLAACSPGESEQHYTAIYYPVPEGIIYADQTVDSLKFITFDDWKLTTSTEWASLSSDPKLTAGTVPPGYFTNVAVPVYFQTNKTGKVRYATFLLAAHDAVQASFIQQPYHNIARPIVKDDNSFAVKYNLKETADSLVFTAYDNWTLSLEADEPWITTKAVLEGAPGRHAIHYLVAGTDNEAAERKAVWKLTSAGITTSIELTQKK